MFRSLLFLGAFLILCLQSLWAQGRIVSESYSVENGLSQNSVSDMLRDGEGFVWFATRDGLSRFDGYSFKNYKASSRQLGRSVSNHFQRLLLDNDGYIWVLNNMGQVLRFDAKHEKFKIYPSIDDNKGDNYITVKQMQKMPDGDIWMIGFSNGCVRVSIQKDSVVTTFFCNQTQQKTGHEVQSLSADLDGNIWILTDNGIAVVPNNAKEPNAYHLVSNKEKKNSLSALTYAGGEVLFASSQGCLFRYDRVKRRFSEFQLPTNSDLNNVLPLSGSKYFISTEDAGYFIFDNRTSQKSEVSSVLGAKLSGILYSFKDVRGDIWFKAKGLPGFYRLDVNKMTTQYLPFGYQGNVYSFSEKASTNSSVFSFRDDRDRLWMMPSASNDIWYADGYSGETPKFEKEGMKGRMFPSVIYPSFLDTMGVMWISTHYTGVEKCVTQNSSFVFTQCKSSPEYIEDNDILAILEDNSGRLWISSQDDCVRIYDSNHNLLGYLTKSGDVVKSKSVLSHVTALYQDRKGAIWVGSNTGVYRFVPRDNSFSARFYSMREDAPPFVSTAVMDILEDSQSRMWFATKENGLMLLQNPNAADAKFIHRNNKLKNNYPPTVLLTRCLFEDTNGNVWLGTNEGITVFSNDFTNPEDIKFFFYNSENTDLDNSCIYDIWQDKDGLMWFASFGGGLFKNRSSFFLGDTPDFISYNKENKKFPSDLVLSIQEDEKGFLWVVTEDAIVKFDKKKQVAEPFGKIRGLDHVGFSERAIVRCKSGEIVVGSSSGYYSFFPGSIEDKVYQPQIVFTRFMIFNKEMEIGTENSPLTETVNNMDTITLNSDQNVFSIEYAALDYRNPAYIQYAYKLDNFETDWNFVGTQRVASYTNLPKGEYLLRVKSTNSEGIWFDNDRVIKIVVLPSFWETGWAILLYVLFGLALVGTILTVLFSFYRLRSKMTLDREMSSMKLQFFTDVSHELRTPLTLINAPLENVLENGKLEDKDREQLEVVHTNTNRMLRLMNQILDFRKIQSNKMRLRVERTNLGEFVSSCSSNFLKIAENRQVKLNITDTTNGASFWIDRDKIDTVMFNLLSNAFKFTSSGKSVSVSISLEDGEGVIRVKDEGCGMPKDKLSVIFERFTTLQAYSLTKQSGTGIGLSLVKEIVDMHKANVRVESEENVGSMFEVRIKPGTAHFDNHSDIIVSDKDVTDKEATSLTEPSPQKKDATVPTLLIIEDNDQMREFLVSVLSKRFNVLDAPNGRVGLETTKREMPDFVITDIMMPEMDGIEYVRAVRLDEQISHIPVVLLTAKTDMQSKLECLKIGANDYITKPFSMVYLETRIDNIIAERKKWQEKYRDELLREYGQKPSGQAPISETPQEEEVKAEKFDDDFMRLLVDYIEKNMDNGELSADDIQDALKVSRWHLLSKVKALVGMTPNEFIRETKLAHAAKLIDSGEYSMTQITYMIGMTDSRYFSRCFKQKYGVTPTEYKERKK